MSTEMLMKNRERFIKNVNSIWSPFAIFSPVSIC